MLFGFLVILFISAEEKQRLHDVVKEAKVTKEHNTWLMRDNHTFLRLHNYNDDPQKCLDGIKYVLMCEKASYFNVFIQRNVKDTFYATKDFQSKHLKMSSQKVIDDFKDWLENFYKNIEVLV